MDLKELGREAELLATETKVTRSETCSSVLSFMSSYKKQLQLNSRFRSGKAASNRLGYSNDPHMTLWQGSILSRFSRDSSGFMGF
jgi:hypothetical protein